MLVVLRNCTSAAMAARKNVCMYDFFLLVLTNCINVHTLVCVCVCVIFLKNFNSAATAARMNVRMYGLFLCV